jgi:hypothetical protein
MKQNGVVEGAGSKQLSRRRGGAYRTTGEQLGRGISGLSAEVHRFSLPLDDGAVAQALCVIITPVDSGKQNIGRKVMMRPPYNKFQPCKNTK